MLTVTRVAPIAELEFSSLYAQTRIFDVRVFRWTQRDGRDVLTPDDGFIVVPAVFSIDPYETVFIRVEPRAIAATSIEQSYKVIVTRVIPGAATPPPTARRVETPLFEPPTSPALDPSVTLKATAPGRADLTVENGGNEHLYLGNVSIEIAQRKIFAGKIAGYVLANSTQTFHLRVDGAFADTNGDLTFDDDRGRQQKVRITVIR